MTIAMAALAIGSAYMGHEQQVKSAEAQGEAIQQANDLQQMDLERQRNQQQAKSAEEANAAHRAAFADMATLDAIAGEYGGGATANRGRAVMGVQQGETLATINSNARNGLTETSYASVASLKNAQSSANAIRAPSQLEGLLTIGAAAGQSWNNYETGQRLDKMASSSGKTPTR
jgi:hypothetical protein